ncbi:hypothetical protein Q0F98_25245 [Paenibacillus amylolyticus]|nr:hypothetical protein Q0F98_25245 [Paenibacillus amylolyticus]
MAIYLSIQIGAGLAGLLLTVNIVASMIVGLWAGYWSDQNWTEEVNGDCTNSAGSGLILFGHRKFTVDGFDHCHLSHVSAQQSKFRDHSADC